MRFPIALLCATVSLSGCGSRPGAQAAWHQEDGYRWRELAVRGGRPGFTAIGGSQSGITSENRVPDSLLLANRILAQGAGVCLGDLDEDGRVDLFLARTLGPNTLYRNLGGWKFEDVTATAGVAAPGREASGCAMADLDGDGHLDLILVTITGPNAVFLNDGTGKLTEHRDLGLDSLGKGGTTLALADVDGDGWLDLYLGNYKSYTPVDRYNANQRAFGNITRQVGPSQYEVNPPFQRDFKLTVRPDVGLALSMRAEPDEFYHNVGGRLVRERLTAGRFREASGESIAEEAESFTLTTRFADLNGDGAPDLYVVNDFEDPDQFWLNDGQGNFRLAPWTAIRQTSNAAMGMDVADVDGDGTADVFLTDMLATDSRRRRTEVATHTPVPKRPGELELQLQQMRNTLFLGRGDGTFTELAAQAGVSATGWSWGALFLDVDLDGRPDLLIANGHPWDIMDGDVQERQQQGFSTVPWERRLAEFPRLALRNMAFRNRGDSTFEETSRAWGIGADQDISHAVAGADLDGDGDQDVVIGRLNAPPLILRNNGGGARIALRLRGVPPNTRAIGATIRVTAPGLPVQTREVTAGGLYLSHSDEQATFAAGAADSLRLEITWRNGSRTVLAHLVPNRVYEITQSEGLEVGRSESRPDSQTFRPADLPTLFEDATPLLAGHLHAENPFDDWGRQYLLPDALSELGPGIAWFDPDQSGWESLVVGTGSGGKPAVFRNQGGRFEPPALGAAAPADLTTVLGMHDRFGARLLFGVSSWEGRTEEELARVPAVVEASLTRGRPGPGLAPLLAPLDASIGPLALGDYTGDGTLDLFVGGRVLPLRYPVPASSALFRNVAGRFILDTLNTRLLEGIGLVTSAMFADLNGDGLPDLVLAREWAAPALFLNAGHGRFAPAPASWSLSRWTGRWNGVAAGDLDGDGRLDLVLTNWGRNTGVQVDSAQPLILVHGPFGARGEEEMLEAQQDTRLGRPAPLNEYLRVRLAVPALAARLRSFGAWAEATLDQAVAAIPGKTSRLEASTLDHLLLLNRGDHFEARPLPAAAQLAPAFYAGIADFDGDGSEDLFLGQNFSYTLVGAPRYDAGRGLLLKGDGAGRLVSMRGSESGLVIYGDQRGAGYADYDADGRLDLAVSQNGGPTRLFHNRGAKAGLRVRVYAGTDNPDGIGAQIRLVYSERMGPVREIQAGSGYWSQNGAVQVFGMAQVPTEVWIRWPGGEERRVPVPRGATEVTIHR